MLVDDAWGEDEDVECGEDEKSLTLEPDGKGGARPNNGCEVFGDGLAYVQSNDGSGIRER